MTLYEQHKDQWDRIAADGFAYLSEASRYFSSGREMDYAIGFNNAVHHWISGGNASRSSNELARRWLEDHKRNAVSAAPIVQSLPQASGVLLLVACPDGTEEKARKLLAFIGCDVTEV